MDQTSQTVRGYEPAYEPDQPNIFLQIYFHTLIIIQYGVHTILSNLLPNLGSYYLLNALFTYTVCEVFSGVEFFLYYLSSPLN